MKPLLIIGAGSFASEVEEMARLLGYSAIAFLDDNPDRARCSPVVGNMDDIVTMKARYTEAIVALGNNEARMKYHNIIKSKVSCVCKSGCGFVPWLYCAGQGGC